MAGAAAAARYRIAPRFTTHLDLLVTWKDGLVEALESLGYELTEIAEGDDRPYLITLSRNAERIDVMIATVPYQKLAIERGAAARVLTPEDVIIHKLLAWRPRDKDDIVSILAADHDLDLEYIEHWAKEWDVADRWAQIRRLR